VDSRKAVKQLTFAETINILGHNNQKPYLSSLAAKQPIAIDKSRSMPFNVQPITNHGSKPNP